MAQANISVTESQFRCPVCLDMLTDPVSTPCGHTYCMLCINDYWDKAEPGHIGCPQCREAFSPRPALRRNTVLAEVVDQVKLYHGEAAKPCLVCLARVEPHREVGPRRRHKLVEAVGCPSERLCAQHRLGLEPPAGVKDAQVEGAGDWEEAQRARRQVQLQESQRTIQGTIRTCERELEEFRRSLESLKVSASAVLEDSEALFADMALHLEKTKTEVRARLEARERSVVGRAKLDMEMLQKDLEALRRRDEEINTLLQKEYNGHLLQAAPLLLCLPALTAHPSRTVRLPTEAFCGARRALCHLRSRVEEVCHEEVDKISQAVNENHASAEWAKENFKPHQSRSTRDATQVLPASFPLSLLSLQPADQKMRAAFLRFFCHLSLDSDTAHPTLVFLDGHIGAHCGEEPQAYPAHPQRFDSVAQVLCREGQFGSSSYWEVEWQGGGWIDIGATYRGIGRKGGGKPCLLGRNENSWRLRCTHTGYAAWHDNRKITVAAPPCPRIGIFLERQKGTLSFYSVSDSMMLLHTFQCLFSQPLYPAFRLDLDSTLLICPQEAGGGSQT